MLFRERIHVRKVLGRGGGRATPEGKGACMRTCMKEAYQA